MKCLQHKWRVWIESAGVVVAAVMVILAIIRYVGSYHWRISGEAFLTIAGVALLAAIYLALDEIRLGKLT